MNSLPNAAPKQLVSELVTDASAALILINNEPGFERVVAALGAAENSYMSAVNFAEVGAKLADDGLREHQIREMLDGLPVAAVPFGAADALAAALLRPLTRHAGLSLGDRACIALAIALNQPVLTADRAWADLGLPIEVILAR